MPFRKSSHEKEMPVYTENVDRTTLSEKYQIVNSNVMFDMLKQKWSNAIADNVDTFVEILV